MRFVVVTGMSGGGKSTVLKMLEDIGFYCVDNLPVSLIESFVELSAAPNAEMNKIALGLDVRSPLRMSGGRSFDSAVKTLRRLRENGYGIEILFMDSSDSTLLKRYKETRRAHPLSQTSRVEDGIREEREIVKEIREEADYVIDTSNLLTRELKEEIDKIFVQNREYNSLMVTILSFGFKYGIPTDADLVFDVRFLPNPFYIEELKHKTGLDKEVSSYVMGFAEAETFLDKLDDLLRFLLPNYVKEGKNQLVIGIGCTGGKHRSVTLAGELYRRHKDEAGYGMKLLHRDVAV